MNPIRNRPNEQDPQRGNLLVLAVLFLAFTASAVLTILSVVNDRTRDVRISSRELIARQAAQGGIHRVITNLKKVRDMSGFAQPFAGVDALDPAAPEGPGGYTRLLNGQKLVDSSGKTVGEYDVFVDVLSRGKSDLRDVAISAYAYLPDKATYDAEIKDAVRADAHCTIRLRLANSQVFDYAYFINHWGWFFGDSIVANGSVRSNGQFDFGNYSSTVNGSPRYEAANGTDLIGYIDDNGDGVTDGSDGGVYSGFQVVNEARVRGMGRLKENQHENDGSITMPNLSDLGWYESQAMAMGSKISVGGTVYVNGVLGDEAGEKANLYLVGTPDKPIVINGPVVVRGSVIISGTVTGKGTIYSGGNVYVAKDLLLKSPPTPWRPAANDEATTEAWLNANMNRDALGLFAREHIVIGDYTNSSWQSYVKSWVNSPLNKSKEDAGADGIQNTRAGPDGKLNTADDDVLEDDGQWTVSRYTKSDADNGFIPPGKKAGDVIPGSGEDIDGDGVYDAPTAMAEFNIPAALDSKGWASNNLTKAVSFKDISTIKFKEIDAVFYTNHTLAALITNSGGDIQMNGAIVSRNEAIIYAANRIIMNHDERLTGRGGDFFGFFLPKSWQPIQILQWEFDRRLPAETVDLNHTAGIGKYFIGAPVPPKT